MKSVQEVSVGSQRKPCTGDVHEQSELQNSRAVLDAALALKTGRIETPSRPGSTATCSIEGDDDEKKVRHSLRRKRKETAVGSQEAGSSPAPSVAGLGDSAAETKVLRRPREKASFCRSSVGREKLRGGATRLEPVPNLATKGCEEKQRENQGFETWTIGKKPKTKPTSTKGVVPEENSNTKDILATTMQCPTLQSRKKQGSGPSRRSEAEGTVVITEKEYRLLLSLKEKSTEVAKKDDLDGKNDSADEVGDVARQKKPGAPVLDLREPGKNRSGCPPTAGKESETVIDNRMVEKGERQLHANLPPAREVDRGEGSRCKGKRRTASSPDPPEVHSSDSDFHSTPEREVASGHIPARPVQRRLQRASTKLVEKNEASPSSMRGTHAVEGRQKRNDEGRLLLKRSELRSAYAGVQGRVLEHQNAGDASRRRIKPSTQRKTFFPFEKAVEEEGLHLDEVGVSARCAAVSDDDDDFEGEIPRGHGIVEVKNKPLLSESEARANRKRKKVEQNLAVQEREAGGHKPFYIMVNAMGTPYGDGLLAWKAEVNKLSRGLDPSIRDIRQQPHQKIQILKKRLTDKFDYSDVISDKYLLPLLGQKVSTRRNELMTAIRAGKECPPGVDKSAWKTLEELSGSVNFQRKSEAMRYANACRQNLGRTGPGGEIGVRDSLKVALRRSPDPDEVQAEMCRDKGYGGKKRKTKFKAVRERLQPETEEGATEGVLNSFKRRTQVFKADGASVVHDGGKASQGGVLKEASSDQAHIIKRMQDEIEELRKRVNANVSQPSSAQTEHQFIK